MPSEIIAVLLAFAPLFSRPVFGYVRVLVCGAILAPGQRTVTSALRAMGLAVYGAGARHAVYEFDKLKARRVVHRVSPKAVPPGTVVRGRGELRQVRRELGPETVTFVRHVHASHGPSRAVKV